VPGAIQENISARLAVSCSASSPLKLLCWNRESDGRPITGILKTRIYQTLKTILWGRGAPAPGQGKAESMKSQWIFFILSLDFEQEQ